MSLRVRPCLMAISQSDNWLISTLLASGLISGLEASIESGTVN